MPHAVEQASVPSISREQYRQVAHGLATEADYGNQLIRLYEQEIYYLEQQIARPDRATYETIYNLSLHALAKETLEEFSELQHRTIDYLAGLLADPDFLSYWTFELLSQNKLSEPQMEKISASYLALSDANPAVGQRRDEDSYMKYLRSQSNEANDIYAVQTPFNRASVPAPPIPSSNGGQSTWDEIRGQAGQGNVLQALRAIDKLKPIEMRGMFS